MIRNPTRREGAFLVFDFEGDHDDLPALLEEIARWIRECAEYAVEQITIGTDLGWTTISVTVFEIRPGDVMQAVAEVGGTLTAAAIAAHVKGHGLREGLRRTGFGYR